MNFLKCCMVGCDNVFSENANNKTIFYAFPTNFNLCMLWVQNSGRPEYFEHFAFGGAQPFLHRHICSDHFNDSDFVNPQDKSLGILPRAIPNLNLVFNRVDIKEEHVDPEYADILSNTLVSENELLQEIKLEKYENDNCDEVNANFSFSSNDDSCNDLVASNCPTEDNEVYRETEEEKKLSNEFFRKYKNAVRSSNRRLKETEEERRNRLKKEALRAKIRRSQETEAQKTMRRMKNALRAAFRRRNETPEQRELRKRKDMLRAQRRRKAETEAEARIRRYNDALRAAYRRNNETEEQRLDRKMKDIVRAAKRRSMESPEQRETRLRKDRERASKRRMIKRISEQINQLEGGLSDIGKLSVPIKIEPAEDGAQPLTISAIGSILNHSNETNNLNHLQQVLEFIETKAINNKPKKKPQVQKVANRNKMSIHYRDLVIHPEFIACRGIDEFNENEIQDNAYTREANSRNADDERYKLTDISGSQETTIMVPNLIDKQFADCSGNAEEARVIY